MTDHQKKSVSIAMFALAAMRIAKSFSPDYKVTELYYIHERLEKAIQANPDDADVVEVFWKEIDDLHERTFPKQQFPPGGVVSEKET